MSFHATLYRNFLADCAVHCTQDALFWRFSVQACNRPRSRAQLAYLFHRLLLKASPRVLINCAVLCSASMRIPTSACIVSTCIAIITAFSSIFSSFYPSSLQLPRRVSPIGIIRSGSASKRERKRDGAIAKS